MIRKIEMHIELTKEEANAISELVRMLDGCPIGLSKADYVDIFRAIDSRQKDPGVTDDFYKICIDYAEEEE